MATMATMAALRPLGTIGTVSDVKDVGDDTMAIGVDHGAVLTLSEAGTGREEDTERSQLD